MINLTPRDRLQYALKVQRLHEVLVLKDDIHLQYKYKNINRATTQAASFQDKIIDAVIEDAVSGTSDPINSSNIKNGVENIIDSNLKNDAKRISYGIPEKAVNAAVSNISNRYQFILGNRIREEIPNLQGKIEDYINTKNLGNLSEAELTNKLKTEYGEHAQKRIQNIIKDSFHTNECNLSWVKAVYDGYSYKIWNNGRTKRTRVWHKAKFIQSVPIDETFDIFGSYPARMMYPGDLNGGAENVANCKCWLSYSNRPPSDLRGSGKKTTTKKSSKSTKSNKSKNNNGLIGKVKNTVKKPVRTVKSKINSINKKSKIKLKQPNNKLKSIFPKINFNKTSLNLSFISKEYNKNFVRYVDAYAEYINQYFEEVCENYVLIQRFYLNPQHKKVIELWSSKFFKKFNEYLRGEYIPSNKKIKRYERIKNILSELIESTDGLMEPTLLFRGEKDVDLSRFIENEVKSFKGFIGSSFSRDVGKKFMNGGKNPYLIIIRADIGVKGIAIDGKHLGIYANQYEWLLNNGQKYRTIKVDKQKRIIIIELV
ncbi:MAG: ADP-ribosyltransferase [Methanobrevibacter sp.]|nr:ADP-ribosyltransferase [Methanobrevibacter sp.]